MIKIHFQDRQGVIAKYARVNSEWVNSRIDFLKLVIRSIKQEIRVQELIDFNRLNGNKKNSLLEFFIMDNFRTKSFTSKDYNMVQETKKIKQNLLSDEILEKLNYLNQSIVERLLVSEPVNLLALEKDFYENATQLDDLNEIIGLVFDYPYLRDSDDLYNLSQICIDNQILSCPCCNDAKVAFDDGKGNPIVSTTADHYFDQARHPLLAISLFNLIPACFKCNTQCKNGKIFTMDSNLNPYTEGFGDFAFFKSHQTQSANALKYHASIELIPEDKNPIHSKLEGNIEVFMLQDTYKSSMSMEIKGIYEKCDANSKEYLSSLGVFLERTSSTERDFYSREFFNHLDESDFQKKNHSKFFKDIIKERLKISNNVNL